MFKILILVCAGADPSACTPATALDVVAGPVVGLQQCLFQGQTRLASTALAPRPGQYAKVICRPATETAANAR